MIANEERRYIPCKEVAKLVRGALKKKYPHVKFSVRSDVYSMGASIDVTWTDGPTSQEVDLIVDQFKGADFDGTQDMKIERMAELNGDPVFFGADYICTKRTHSPDLVTKVAQAYCAHYGYDVPEILVSCGYGYVDHCHPYRNPIMQLVYSCTENDLKGLSLCRYHGDLVIKKEGMQEDVPCVRCRIFNLAEDVDENGICCLCRSESEGDPVTNVIDIRTRKPISVGCSRISGLRDRY